MPLPPQRGQTADLGTPRGLWLTSGLTCLLASLLASVLTMALPP